jgi:TorA maturation chaperone TorD
MLHAETQMSIVPQYQRECSCLWQWQRQLHYDYSRLFVSTAGLSRDGFTLKGGIDSIRS